MLCRRSLASPKFKNTHDDMPLAVDVLSVADSPNDGIVSYSTIGLFEIALGTPVAGI
jgi:hypothetical protein